ncbi:GNAT family N-acetyltransferase [Aeromonas veronii]
MIEVSFYREDMKDEWDGFCAHAKNSIFLFNRDFIEYHKDRFTDGSLVVCKDNKIVALLPASKHGDSMVSHGGLTYGGVITGKDMRTSLFLEIFDAITRFLFENNFKKLIIKCLPEFFSNESSGELQYALFTKDATRIKCDLSTVIYQGCRGKVSKGRKWIISKAKKHDVTVCEGNDFDKFYELQSMALDKHGVKPVHNPKELRSLQEKFPDNIKLFFAQKNADLMAAAVIFKFEHVVHTQYLATTPLGKENGALDLLIETLITNYKDIPTFSFGISTEQNGRYLNAGLCQQKESFGGYPVSLETYEVTLNG